MEKPVELREITIERGARVQDTVTDQNVSKKKGTEIHFDEICVDLISVESICSLETESNQPRKQNEREFYLYTAENGTKIVAAKHINKTEFEIATLPGLTTQVFNRIQLKRMNNNYWKPLMAEKLEEINEFILNLIHSGDVQLIKKAYTQFQILDSIFPCPFTKEKKTVKDHDSLLHICARHGSGEIMKNLLESKHPYFPINVKSPKLTVGDTILHAAAKERNVEAANAILNYIKQEKKEKKLPVNERRGTMTELGRRGSLLLQNLSKGSRVALIITSGPDFVNQLNANNETVCHICVQKSCHDLLKIFMNEGADLTIQDKYGHNVLHEAAIQNDATASNMIMQYYKDKGEGGEIAFKNLLIAKNVKGESPTQLAQNVEIIEIFLSFSEDSLERKEHLGILLASATERNKQDIAIYLASKGANLNDKNDQGMTPLKLASLRGFKDLAKYLLKEGIDPNYNEDPKTNTPINNAAKSGHLDLVKILIEYKASLWDENIMDMSALHSAVNGGHSNIVRFLIEKKNMNPNIRDTHGKTPLYYAVERGWRECVKELLNCEADPELDVDKDKQKAVHLAASNNNKNIMKILLEYGAKSEEKDKNEKAPIDIAVQKDYPHILELQLEYGVSLERNNYDLNTPMHTIALYGSYRCASYLLREAKMDVAFKQLNTKNVDKETPINIAKRKEHYAVLFIYIQMVHTDYFLCNPTIYHELLKTGQHDIMKVIFDRMCVENKAGTEIHCTAIMLDTNAKGDSPQSKTFSHFPPSLIHELIKCKDKELREHPIVKKIVEKKLKLYRIWYTLTLFLYIAFLIFLSTSLHLASLECDSNLRMNRISMDEYNLRILLEVTVMVCVIVLTFSEIVEFFYGWSRIYKEQRSKRRLKHTKILHFKHHKIGENQFNKKNYIFKLFELGQELTQIIPILDRSLFYFPRSTIQYISNSILDVIGIVSLIFYYSIRFMNPSNSWIFGSLAYISFILSLLKYTRIISSLGAYIETVKAVFSKDIPRFLVLYLVLLASFIGGLHLASRFTSIPMALRPQNMRRNSCSNNTNTFFYFNEEMSQGYTILRPLVTGIILILDGGPGNREDDLFQVELYFALIYLTFSFVFIVIVSNILIAQLSETYGTLSAQGTFYYRMGLVVTMELESSLSFFLGKYFRQLSSIPTFTVPIEEWKTLLNENPEKNTNKQLQELEENICSNTLALAEGNERALTIMEYLAPLGEKIDEVQKNIDDLIKSYFDADSNEGLPELGKLKPKGMSGKVAVQKKIEILESSVLQLGTQNAAIDLKLDKILDMLKK